MFLIRNCRCYNTILIKLHCFSIDRNNRDRQGGGGGGGGGSGGGGFDRRDNNRNFNRRNDGGRGGNNNMRLVKIFSNCKKCGKVDY